MFIRALVAGYSSPALPDMQKQGVLSDDQASWFGALLNIGAMVKTSSVHTFEVLLSATVERVDEQLFFV